MSKKRRETNGTNAKEKKNQKTNRGQKNGGGAEVRRRSIPGGNDINAADYNASSPPPVSLISLSLSSPRRDKKSSGKTPRWQRAFITPFGAESSICIPRENATRRKKNADAICKTPTGVGRERAMVIEEAGGRGQRQRGREE